MDRGVIDYNNFEKIQKFRNYYDSTKAYDLYKDTFYVHKKIIILIGKPETGKSSLA